MNKNKIIFAVIGIIFLGLVMIVVNTLATSSDKDTEARKPGNLSIWIMNDDRGTFNGYIDIFKQAYPQYVNKNITVESFSDYTTYQNALNASIIAGSAPDIFVLNNSENSIAENQILGINPAVISPNEFRTNFKPIFGEDLILTDEDDNTVEFLKGIPAGYEVLGVFYNRKYFLKPSEMETWSSIAKEVKSISAKHSRIIPMALWNGVWVTRATDIVKTLFGLEGSNTIFNFSESQAKQVLAMYSEFWEKNSDNRYNILSAPFIEDTDIDFFTQGDVAAMIGYPRDLIAIDKIWYQKSFLFAAPFPHYAGKEQNIAIDYNYFSINKDTIELDMALNFLNFMASSAGQQAYVDTFPYYLSPEISVETNMLEKKILPAYNIVYKNFLHDEANLVSYNVGNKSIFDTELKHILDLESWYDSRFSQLRSYLVCSATKYSSLINLSSSCK